MAQAPHLKLTLFASISNIVTDIRNAGDSRIFVVDKTGTIYVLDSAGNVNPKPFLDITPKVNSSDNETGLLSLVFSPGYKTDGFFYATYVDSINYEHIVRFHVSKSDSSVADSTSETNVLTVYHPYSSHFSGELQFGHDGYLYIGLGDGGSGGDPGNRAQNLDSLLGKILRIDVSNLPYSIPPSNPFVNDSNTRAEIWAYGLRNPWKFGFDRITNDLWIADVGQERYEEVDFQKANNGGGENYGWHCYEADSVYVAGCAVFDYIFPVYFYPHGTDGCAVIGGYVYRGALCSSLFGEYVFSDLCSGILRTMVKNDSGTFTETDIAQGDQGEYNTFGQDEYGELYVGEGDGEIFKISDSSCAPVAFINAKDSVQACGTSTVLHAIFNPSLTYQWNRNDTEISGATNDSLVVLKDGNYSVSVMNGPSCASVSASVNVILNNCSGVRTNTLFKGVNLSPNPNTGTFLLEINVQSNAQTEEVISNAIGQICYSQNSFLHSGVNDINFSLNHLAAGAYFLKIKSAKGNLAKQFVVY